jgi:flavin-dependent dehydrogenase
VIDLLVAGGGPAGLATAINAAMAGLDVVVVERRPAPIDKACGEGLMPGAVRALGELGAVPDGHPLYGIRYLHGPHRAEAAFREGPGLGVRRTALHQALSRRAAELGIPVVEGRVDEVGQNARTVTAAGFTARYLAAADGLHSRVRRSLGLHRPPAPGREARYGLRRHFAVAPWSGHIEVHWSARAEAYVTPIGPALVGVALLTADRAPFDRQLAGFPELAGRLGGHRAVTPVRGAGPLRQRATAKVAGRVLLVGDAAGYIDALTGDGIAVALACAPHLVRCVREARPQDYEHAWRRASRAYRLITTSLLWLRDRPRLAPLIVPAAARFPAVFEAAVHRLASTHEARR